MVRRVRLEYSSIKSGGTNGSVGKKRRRQPRRLRLRLSSLHTIPNQGNTRTPGMALFPLVLVALIGNVLCLEYKKVILGGSFTLPVNCRSDEEGTLLKHESPTSSRTVAAHRSGVWIPEESFKDRIKQNFSLVFDRAVCTDSGVYVLKCGGREVDFQVEVVMSSDKTVKEGEAVRLPCHYLTIAADTCWTVRWAKGREDVLRWSSCDDKSNWTADDRLSLSANWLSHGDLSLNLQPARKDDEGDYFCFIKAKGGRYQNGIPGAASLEVSERSPDQITSTSPPPLPPVSVSIHPFVENSLLNLLSVSLTLLFFSRHRNPVKHWELLLLWPSLLWCVWLSVLWLAGWSNLTAPDVCHVDPVRKDLQPNTIVKMGRYRSALMSTRTASRDSVTFKLTPPSEDF